MSTPANLMIGRRLKHYVIEKLLGQGGMGLVYLARDTRLERSVALKLLKPELLSDPERKGRFLREARSAAALTHPAIAQVYDIDEDQGMMFIAMEYIDGRTVSRLIADGELDLLGTVEISLQVAEGLAKAHEANIIHRDIKSDNIMVNRDGHAKLLDFGLAKLLETGREKPGSPEDVGRTLTQEQAQTLAGAVMGTINYMSPEQVRGRALDPATDIFSFGVVLYEMVTGERPFKGESPVDTMHAIAFEEPRPAAELRKNLPPQLQRIIVRCLRKRPEDRYPDARSLANDLKAVQHDLETGTRRSLPPAERVREWAERIKSSFPFGTKGFFIVAAAVILSVLSFLTRIQWGNLIWPVVIALLVYRTIKNRKRRMLDAFTKKVSSFPEVRAIIIKENQVTVVLSKAPAKVYIRISSLVDGINRKLYFGQPVVASVRDDVSEAEYRSLLRTTGLVYVQEDRPENS